MLGSIAKLIALVFPLGLDTFAVAAAVGMAGLPTRKRLRISLPFTTFEGGMWGGCGGLDFIVGAVPAEQFLFC